MDALAALRREQLDDVVAGGERGHALTDALDDPGSLVPEDRRRVAGGVGARGGVEVFVADAAGHQADQHLAGPRLGEVDLLNRKRLSEPLEYGGAHLHLPLLPGMAPILGRIADRLPHPFTVVV